MIRFPFGKAPLALLLSAAVSGAILLSLQISRRGAAPPDLVFATFAESHYNAYKEVLPEFENRHGVDVQLQLVHVRALKSRLQSAMLAGIEDVPDLVELNHPSMGYFARGPLEEVGFIDLTELIEAEGFDETMVSSRFSLWTSRGRIFALPHDVHPVALAYRRDIVEELGVDVDEMETWEDFVAMGREITRDLDGDGVVDRYALETNVSSANYLNLLLLQQGVSLFDARGRLTMDDPRVVDTIVWYVKRAAGPERIGFPAGSGQQFARTVREGLVVFYYAPDWRTVNFESHAPAARGKMALMPLPAWEEGGRRTSTWGGTGLALTKARKDPDGPPEERARFELAWKLAKFLYASEETSARLFEEFNILPPFAEAWDHPVFSEPNAYYGGQPIGELLVELADDVPPDHVSAYTESALAALGSALVNTLNRYRSDGPEGLRAYAAEELSAQAARVQRDIDRNVFLRPGPDPFPERDE